MTTTDDKIIAIKPACYAHVHNTDWLALTVTARHPGEHPLTAAHRVALFLLAYTERNGVTPNLGAANRIFTYHDPDMR